MALTRLRAGVLNQSLWHGLLVVIWLTIIFPSTTNALTQQYCANFNTGTGSAVSNDFNSNGKCQDQCSGSAFAVVQGKNCWCSNFAPSTTTTTDDCSVPCPGYPYENCGDESQGNYGYVALGPAPSGTVGNPLASSTPIPTAASSPPPQSTPAPSPSPTPSTTDIATPTPAPTTSSTTSSPTTTSSSISTTSSTHSSSSTWTPVPVLSVMTLTGQVMTLTITPSAPPAATQTIIKASSLRTNNGLFASPGKVAGLFVAIALVIIALAAALIAFILLRRRRLSERSEMIPSTAGSLTPQRRTSRLSQTGLLGGSTTSREQKPVTPSIMTSGWGVSNSSEKSPSDTLDRHSSYPRIVDQRLEPAALWNPLHDNGSHISVRSFRDDQDYSRRMLRIANPDEAHLPD